MDARAVHLADSRRRGRRCRVQAALPGARNCQTPFGSSSTGCGDQAIAATVVHLPAERFLEAIRRNLRLAGVVAAGVLSVGLVASVILARWVTGPVSRLTAAATALETHTFDPESLAEVTRRPDELGHLARVFHRMALEVYAREQRLRQEVQQLRIEIDEAKKVRQVAEITETDYFQDLRQRAQALRARFGGPGDAPSAPGAH
ncbi:MAG: hypothetical protein DMD90_06880 [Candidatus Rokuibacteriota bacterium]|nr:MAG: hypothetical protein DMD90_06880 [Candidatus Rokubacteria bacterium]